MENSSIIIDNGTYRCKAGYSYDDVPRVDIPTVLGFPSSQGGENDQDQIDIFVGEEALQKGGILDLHYPIVKGEFKDLPIMERIWKHIFHTELVADIKSYHVVVTAAAFAKYSNKKEMAQSLFEKLNIESLYITNTSTLSLYANGKTTGIVVDIGYQTTSCVPIYEGFVLNHAVGKADMGGEELNNYFIKLINEDKENNKKQYTSTTDKATINELKEKVCYVAEDYDSECKKSMDLYSSNSKNLEVYDLPDGSKVMLGAQKFKCPEMLFQPSLAGSSNVGIHEQAFKSIKVCDEDINRDLFLNVVLCGGSSLFSKIKPRLTKELQSLAPTGRNVNVIAPPERKYSAWLGGAILTSLDSFRNAMFVQRKDYLENPDCIFNKFF